MSELPYCGSELDLFASCVRWKAYFSQKLRRHIGPTVVEVGAGLGANTGLLCGAAVRRWVCLEPDAALAGRINARIDSGRLPPCCEVRIGTVSELGPTEMFDTALYIDVLEHIQDDSGELGRIAGHLVSGGTLIVLAPAHQFLYSPFDRAIGHYRRYNRTMLRRAAPAYLRCIALKYLDSAGLLASTANRLFLKSSMPGSRQLWFWDRFLVPASTYLDTLLGYSLGKSIVGVWVKK